ncbi:MAG: 5-formyltetrahydrofolate cyclo-ligase [Gammaproteobacteria bacterium]|jgi:5-formyltetrahydrofolate cyclo-ligase
MRAAREDCRRAGRLARRALEPAERVRAGDRIESHLAASSLWHAAGRVGLYFARGAEVDLSRLALRAFATAKIVHVPVVGRRGRMRFARVHPDSRLCLNRFGILEPESPPEYAPARSLDLVITPLVAFDDDGNRIGMGAGYYDRCFRFLRHRTRWVRPKLVGAAFSCQRLNSIPAAPWDVPLFAIATEEGFVRF